MPRHRRCQLPQRIGEDVRQHQVERRGHGELRRRESGGANRLHQMSGPVRPRILARDGDRQRIDIGREDALVQRLGRGNRQHAGAGAEIEHASRTPGLQHMVEQQQAAPRGAVMAGAERQRRLDLDAELVGRNAVAVVLAMDDEAAGGHRDQIFQARLDPIPGFDRVENHAACGLGIGGVGHELAQQRLIGRIGKMHRDVPAPVRPLERGDRGLVIKKNFGQDVDDTFGSGFVPDRKAGAMGGRGGGSHWKTDRKWGRRGIGIEPGRSICLKLEQISFRNIPKIYMCVVITTLDF